MGKTKKDTNARVAGRREQTEQKIARRCKCAWIIFQWISMSWTIHRYRTHQKSHCKRRCYRCRVPKFLQNFSILLTRSFCPLDTIAIGFIRVANFRFFTHWCVFIRSLLFRTGKQIFPWFMFTYNLIELHLIRKILGLTMLTNWVASQFVVSI